jgi:AbrB family looped-hinge helix DNA binding protein
MKVRVSSKGQIVLPAEIRGRLGIEKGAELEIVELAGVLYLVPVVEGDPLDMVQGLLAGTGYTMEEFYAERRRDKEREEAKYKRWGL